MDPSKSSNHWNGLKLSVLIPAALSALILFVTRSFYSPSWEISLSVVVLAMCLVGIAYKEFKALVVWQVEEQSSSFFIPSWYVTVSILIFLLCIPLVYSSFHLDPAAISLVTVDDVRFIIIALTGTIAINICYWAVANLSVRKNWCDIKMDYLSEIGERPRVFD